MGLSESQLPWESGVLDTSPARSSRSSIVARDEDVVGFGLGDSRSDDSDSDLRDELDGDAGARVGALEVVDELFEVLDRVDVVVRRRRDESDSGGRVTGAGDRLGDLVAGELSSLSRLGSLRHLDLQLVGVGEVVGGDSEACARERSQLGAKGRGRLELDSRPEAICLIAERIVSPLGMISERSASSPPSPVLDLPPCEMERGGSQRASDGEE